MLPESPVSKIAFPQFFKQFGDLLSPHIEITQYEYTLVTRTYEIVFLGHYTTEQTSSLRDTARVALKIVEAGAAGAFEEVASAFLVNSERVVRQMSKIWRMLGEARELDNVDKKINAYLQHYKIMYEGLHLPYLPPLLSLWQPARVSRK